MRYELSYIIKGDLEAEITKEISQGLVSFVSGISQDTKIIIQPKAQELAYPIKKQTQGFWGALEFSLEEEKLSELEKKLKETKEIIRFMITKKPVEKKKKKKKKKPAQSQASERTRQTTELLAGKKAETKEKVVETKEEEKQKPLSQKAKKEEKVEIKDLDKKLDEILGKI